MKKYIWSFIKKWLGPVKRYILKRIRITPMLIYELNLNKPAGKKSYGNRHLSFEFANLDDIKNLTYKECACDRNAKKYAIERFEKGDRCLLAKYRGEIMGYFWIMNRAMELSQFNHIPLPDHKAYLYRAFVVQSYRGQRILCAMHNYYYELLKAQGKTNILEIISIWNKSSIKAHKRIGMKPIGMIMQIRFFGFAHDCISKASLRNINDNLPCSTKIPAGVCCQISKLITSVATAL